MKRAKTVEELLEQMDKRIRELVAIENADYENVGDYANTKMQGRREGRRMELENWRAEVADMVGRGVGRFER